MKKNPFIFEKDSDDDKKSTLPRKKLNHGLKESFIFNYSKNEKGKKKRCHSIFFGQNDIEKSTLEKIWDDKTVSESLTFEKEHRFVIPPYGGDLNDAIKYCQRIINDYKWLKRVLIRSRYTKKRSPRQIKPNQIEIDNKNILLALELKTQGFTYQYISKKTNLTISKIKNAVYKESIGIKPFIKGKGAKNKLSKPHIDYLLQILKEGINGKPILMYKELRENLIKKFAELSKNPPVLNTIIKYTQKKLRFSKKKGSNRFFNANNENIKFQRKEMIFKLISLNIIEKEFIYIDETHFNINMAYNRGISEINKRFLKNNSNKGENITAIAAISRSRLVELQLFKGGVKANDFGCFLINLINKNEFIRKNIDKYIFFMDNCSIHKGKDLRKFLNKINIFYKVVYSCDLNPIERIFGIVKRRFKNINENNETKLKKKLLNHLNI